MTPFGDGVMTGVGSGLHMESGLVVRDHLCQFKSSTVKIPANSFDLISNMATFRV